MHVISRDAPCYYLTSVTRNRLPIFQTDQVKLILCAALNEARQSANFALYAYVIMRDHLHIITDSMLSPGKTLRFINGITGHRVVQYLKENNYTSSLQKLQHSRGPRRYSHSVWDHHPDARLLLTENMLMQRVNYTHENPVRAGLVTISVQYRWSSVRCWNGKMHYDEPLHVDIDRIRWRQHGGIASDNI
jgi:REP element-mobilizing transposase RayT